MFRFLIEGELGVRSDIKRKVTDGYVGCRAPNEFDWSLVSGPCKHSVIRKKSASPPLCPAFKLRTSRVHIRDASHPESAWQRHCNMGECDTARMPPAVNPREDPGSPAPS
jgi:hypothetical protein